MSQRLLQALGGITSIVVTTTLLHVSPGQASEPDPSPIPLAVHVTAKADGPDHFTSEATVDVPGGGYGSVTSPSVSNTMTKATVKVSAPLSDQPGFSKMAMTMFQLPTPGKRLLACITLTPRYLDSVVDKADESIEDLIADEERKLFAFFLYCVRLAQLVSAVIDEAASARFAGTACPALPLGVKTKTEKVDGKYQVTAAGPLTSKKKNSRLKVKCTASGNGYTYKIKPRKKGATLKSVVGKDLKVGIASPPGAEGAQVKVSFKP